MLVSYIRDNVGKPVGCIVAVQHASGDVTLGVSLHNPKDKWNRNLAKEIAIGRAHCHGVMPYIPRKKEKFVVESVRSMINRASRYFKDSTILQGSLICDSD